LTPQATNPMKCGRSGDEAGGAGAPESEITAAMIDAGVKMLDEGLIDECALRPYRPELVRDIYLVMRAISKGDF